MSAEQYNTTERSSQDKKPEWARSLVGHHQQHAYYLHQNLQQAQMPQQLYAHHHHHHHHLPGGSLEGTTFQSTGAQPAFANLNPTIVMQSAHDAMPLLREQSDAASFSHTRFGFPPLHASSNNNNNHKGSANIAARSRHPRGAGAEQMHQGKTGAALSMSTSTKSSAPRRMRNSSLSPLTVRPVGTKDRHSKVRTAKGLRDRRVRLSAPTAIQFFDVQDRLGYDQPSKAVDWLIKKARAAIDELAPVEGVIIGDGMVDTPVDEWKLSKEHVDLHMHSSFVKIKDEEQSLTGGGARAESRAKARERARERAKEKTTTPIGPTSTVPTSMETTSTSPVATTPAQPFTTPNLHLLPEFFLLSSQFRPQLDELHRPSDLSSMLTPPSAPSSSPHLIPFASPFFPTHSAAPFMFSGEGPPLQYSVSPTTYNTISTINNNNTPNSPRGTLQSIFSSPAVSSMQAHVPMPPLMMMGGPVQAHAYGVTTLSSIVREGGHDNDAAFRQSSAELVSPDSHQHSRIPVRIRGMELGSRVEETRITPSSMQADYQ